MDKHTGTTTAPATPSASKAAADRAIRNRLQDKFAEELAIFSACVIGAVTIFRILQLVTSRIGRRPVSIRGATSAEEKQGSGGKRDPLPMSLRRAPLAFAALFRNTVFRVAIPFGPCGSVAELIFIVIYIAGNLIWLFVDTRNLYRVFYQDRAAHLGSVQISLVVALAGKNNIISFLTGVGHEKLNVLHRAAARTSVLLLWTHAISRTVSVLPPQFDFTHGWMQAGAVGLVSFSLVVALSLRPIRNMAFEFFLVSHIILIALAIVSAIIHTKFRGCHTYIWPALLVWGLDRLTRVGRLILNNFGIGKKQQNASHSSASVELLNHDTIRLTLHRRFSWKAGQHAYVILPSVSQLPTEAHPFTIASIPDGKDGEDNTIIFLVRARSGFTARLKEVAHAAGGESTSVPAYIDGPYGCPPDTSSASTCILIAGGSGVSFTLPLLQQVLKDTEVGKETATRVLFVWAVRDGAHVSWISKALTESLSSVPKTLSVDAYVYVTGPGSDIPVIDYTPSITHSEDEKKVESPIEEVVTPVTAPAYDFLKIERGRPDLRKLLNDEIELTKGHVQVNVAGPSPMTRQVKVALRKIVKPSSILRGMPTVSLNVESFGMVNK